ncbi:MAG: glutaminase A [Verrucomicrobiae bacterium]|nr:glutaminase A [Verrucomicrobiae bacterium]
MHAKNPSSGFVSPLELYLQRLYDKFSRLEDGQVATYIPELGRARPSWFGIAVATVDGRVYSVGDAHVPFTIQSISKPIVYGLALETNGLKRTLNKVGVEPSGEAFNSISLDQATGRPLNPMINAGAIATTSLVPGDDLDARWRQILDTFSAFCGRPLSLDENVYVSERDTGHRNRAIAHLLRNFGILEGDPEAPLDLYFRQCSISITCRDLAIMAACLASGGVNPVTGRRVLEPQNTGRVLSIMSSCGMYDYAGEWIYNVGMPAKSGVAGGILAVLPGQFGIGVFSPPLDAKGNSVRGIRVCSDLSTDFGLHLFNTPRIVTSALRGMHTIAEIRSKRRRSQGELDVLRRHGRAVRIYQLRGRLILSTLEPVIRTVLENIEGVHHVIVDMTHAVDLDRAACRLLLDLREQLSRLRVRMHLAGVADKTVFREYVVSQIQEDGWRSLCSYAGLDDALEHCEGEVLRHAGPTEADPSDAPLEQQELCRGLSPGELSDLAGLLVPVNLPTGHDAITAGSPADSLYFLVRGEVGVFLQSPDGPEQLISRLGPGMSFGELALVDREPRSATVRCLTPIDALRLEFGDFDRLDSTGLGHLQTKIYANLAAVLATRLRSANLEIESLR